MNEEQGGMYAPTAAQVIAARQQIAEVEAAEGVREGCCATHAQRCPYHQGVFDGMVALLSEQVAAGIDLDHTYEHARNDDEWLLAVAENREDREHDWTTETAWLVPGGDDPGLGFEWVFVRRPLEDQ